MTVIHETRSTVIGISDDKLINTNEKSSYKRREWHFMELLEILHVTESTKDKPKNKYDHWPVGQKGHLPHSISTVQTTLHKVLYSFLFFFSFLAVPGFELMASVFARQTLYHLSCSTSLFLCWIFLR
jgi:hypothetical protein